jgi:hypothetical protein
MCLASKYLNQLDEVAKGIENDYKKLSKKQSEYDLQISELYHKIETANFNACEGYYFSKQLQEILRKRRTIKNELVRLNSLRDTLNLRNSLNNKNLCRSKQSLNKIIKNTNKYQQDWKYTYSLEEVLM